MGLKSKLKLKYPTISLTSYMTSAKFPNLSEPKYPTGSLAHFNSVQFSCSVMSDSLWPHESQHARPACPSTTPRLHSNPCPSSRWCHPAISSSVVPFSSCPQSLPASESFPMSQLFAPQIKSMRSHLELTGILVGKCKHTFYSLF